MKTIRILGRIKKKLFRKKPVLILAAASLCVILLGSVVLAYTVYKSPTQHIDNKPSIKAEDKRQAALNKPETEIPQQKLVKSTENAPQSPSASPTPSSTRAAAAPRPGLKPNTGTSTQTPCEKYIPVYYPDYYKKVNAEASQHVANLAALKQAYETNHPYPSYDDTAIYNASIAAENNRFNQASMGNYNNYRSTLAALGCYI